MDTDKQVYSIFEAHPRWLFELTGLPWPGKCRFASVELKAISRTTDGVIYPEDLAASLTVAEFQFQYDSTIYNRIVIEMSLLQQENAGRAIQGCIFFLNQSLDPRTEPWGKRCSRFFILMS